MLLACIFLPLAAVAQSTTSGAIGGIVTDSLGAVVHNATITLVNLGTEEKKSGTTDRLGSFRVVALAPGQYDVTLQAESFASYKSSAVTVEVGSVTELKIVLKPAGVSETVHVSGESPLVNTTQPDFATNVDETALEELPINGRKWSSFALLTPGVTPDGPFGLLSFRGISGLLNMNTVDGGNNNTAFWSEERGRTRAAYVISQSSAREFQVNTSNYSAEYGRAAGAVVNTVTKSGSNALHGQTFYFMRDNALGATNPLSYLYTNPDGSANAAPVPFKAQDRRQQFGGNLGGPILKDKLFFFFNYDGQRRNFPGVAALAGNSTLLSALYNGPSLTTGSSAGDLNTVARYLKLCSGNACNNLSPAVIAQVRGYYSSALDFLRSEMGTVPRTGNQDIFFPKLDWVINRKNVFTASYNRMRWNSPNGVQTTPTYNDGIASWGNDAVKTDMVMGRLRSVLSSNVTSEFRYQFGRELQLQLNGSPSAAEVSNGLVPASGYVPQIDIASQLWIGTPANFNRYAHPDETRHQLSHMMNWIHRRHFVKFGVDVDRTNDLSNHLRNGFGSYSYSTLNAFVEDWAIFKNGAQAFGLTPGSSATKNWTSYEQAFGPQSVEYHTWDFAGFIQDDWQITRRLTLNLGLRYEFQMLPNAIYPNPGFPTAAQTQGTLLAYLNGANPTAGTPADKNNFGPRIGFAWNIFGNGKAALRGGYGIYYGRINNGAIGSVLLGSGTRGVSQVNNQFRYTSACSPTFPNVYAYNSLPGCASGATDIVYFDPHLQNPQIHQVDLILEREIARHTVASIAYLGSFGRHMMQWVDRNLPAGQPTGIAYYQISGGPLNNIGSTCPGAAAGTNCVAVPFYSGSRPISSYGSIVDAQSSANSSYHAMVLRLRRRMSSGLQFHLNYTWSHAIDNTGNPSQTLTTSYGQVYDPNNLAYERGSSNFDIRHRLVAAVVWQPRYFREGGKFTRSALDGWTVSPIVVLASGRPYTELVTGNDYYCTSATDCNNTRYGIVSAINGTNGSNRLATVLPRNYFRYPVFANVDLRIARRFKINERQRFELLAEVFNLFNRTQVTNVNNNLYVTVQPTTPVTAYSPATLAPTTLLYQQGAGSMSQAGSNLYRERQIQLGARYSF